MERCTFKACESEAHSFFLTVDGEYNYYHPLCPEHAKLISGKVNETTRSILLESAGEGIATVPNLRPELPNKEQRSLERLAGAAYDLIKESIQDAVRQTTLEEVLKELAKRSVAEEHAFTATFTVPGEPQL